MISKYLWLKSTRLSFGVQYLLNFLNRVTNVFTFLNQAKPKVAFEIKRFNIKVIEPIADFDDRCKKFKNTGAGLRQPIY